MARSSSEQALVDFILKTIRTRTTNEIIDYQSNMGISLKEMMTNGLTASQINGLPIDFIRLFIEDGNISIEDLEDLGVDEAFIQNFTKPFDSDEISNHSVFNIDFFEKNDANTDSSFMFNSERKSFDKSIFINQIQEKQVRAEEVTQKLISGLLETNDLLNIGFSLDFIERLKQYESQEAESTKFNDLAPLRENSSDIYFLGMPGSGKSSMLATFMSHCNRIGILGNIVDNQKGTNYKNQLILGMALGFLPNSTKRDFINYIPVDMKYEGQSDYQSLNFIDMAGEKFKDVAKEGIHNFNDYKNYLNNQNPKCLIFVIEYIESNVAALKQDQNLQQVLALLEKFGILKKTEAVYLIVTKADLFPSANKQEFAEQYISSKYKNFENACLDAMKKYKFGLKSFPYSIGQTSLEYILLDCNPETNNNLTEYPKILLEQIEYDMSFNKTSLISKWFGK